jgi:hypothetical protein
MAIHSSSTADFRSSFTDIDAGSATPVAPNDPDDVVEAPQAQYAPAETIIDNMTTVREAHQIY